MTVTYGWKNKLTEYDKERKQWQFISDENDIEIINNKLDWIAYRLMKLTLSVGEGMTGQEVEEYKKLFTS